MKPFALLALGALAGASPPPPAPPAPQLPPLVIHDAGALRILNAEVHADGDGLRVTGRVCRRINWSGMQASVFDIDRVAANGLRVEHADAAVPHLSIRIDQSCGGWQTHFKGPIQPGDRIVVCVPLPHGHCQTE